MMAFFPVLFVWVFVFCWLATFCWLVRSLFASEAKTNHGKQTGKIQASSLV